MSVTCYYSGRWGNIVFALAHMIAYAKKHKLKYYVSEQAVAYNHFRNGDVRVPFTIPSTGPKPINPIVYKEPNMAQGVPCYHEIPKMDNVLFDGYFQSFLYFSWCRNYILETFKFPYRMEKGIVSISVRRGDCVGIPAFPIAPVEYYHNAIRYMQERGYNLFRVHSDDQEYCRKEFTSQRYNGAVFQFTAGNEMSDFFSISSCEHNITARSTFSLTAAWFNKNPGKVVLVPTTKHKWWGAMNADLLTGTNFIQIDFEDPENKLK